MSELFNNMKYNLIAFVYYWQCRTVNLLGEISKALDKLRLIVIDGKMIVVRLTLEICVQAHWGMSGLLEFTKQLFCDGHQNSLKHQCGACSLEPILKWAIVDLPEISLSTYFLWIVCCYSCLSVLLFWSWHCKLFIL